jgi:hypothetical protein
MGKSPGALFEGKYACMPKMNANNVNYTFHQCEQHNAIKHRAMGGPKTVHAAHTVHTTHTIHTAHTHTHTHTQHNTHSTCTHKSLVQHAKPDLSSMQSPTCPACKARLVQHAKPDLSSMQRPTCPACKPHCNNQVSWATGGRSIITTIA